MFGRTLVIAKIDETKENLVTLLAGSKGQIALSDEQLLEIDKHLLVGNEKELKEKFPKLCSYEYEPLEQQEADGKNNIAHRIKAQSEGQFQVWYPKKKTKETAEKTYSREQQKEIELYMGIQTFFRHSRENTSGILFLNMSLTELLESKNKEKLELYLSTVNHKEEESQAIQFAILPEVSMEDNNKYVRERFLGTGEKEKKIQPQQVIELSSLLASHKILLCYQYETTEKTSAEAFAKNGQNYYKQENQVYERNESSKYMCCCYPNLTSPRENMYIGAAFVTAGMLSGGCKEGALTLLPKELYPYAQITREEMKQEKYGCCLTSETVEQGWAAVPQMMLCSARTLSWKKGEYETVEELLTEWKEREK